MAKQVFTTGQILTAAQMTTLQANDYNQTVSAKTANYTLVAADAGTRITMNNAGATTITVNTSVFTAGDTLTITNIGAGVCTITAGTATVSTSSTLALKQYDSGQLYFTSTGVAIFFASDAADSPLTTKGDLFTFSTNDARLAVGNSGETLVANSAAATGLSYQPNFAAGKNKIINGDFTINQRAFTSATATGTYMFDRWYNRTNGDGTGTFSAETFTPGTAPVAGYEATNFIRIVTSGSTNSATLMGLRQSIEDIRTLAGQTVTLSFWAKAASGTPKVYPSLLQVTGSGGSANVEYLPTAAATLSTSWARYSFTYTLANLSGVTIGTGSYLMVNIIVSAGTNFAAANAAIGIQNATFDFWGLQVEAGSVATAFQTATGTLQGELAACQRYYYRTTPGNDGRFFGISYNYNTTNGVMQVNFPVTMRVRPTALEQSGTAADYAIWRANTVAENLTSVPTYDGGTTSQMAVMAGATAGNLTANTMTAFVARNANAYLGWSAEL